MNGLMAIKKYAEGGEANTGPGAPIVLPMSLAVGGERDKAQAYATLLNRGYSSGDINAAINAQFGLQNPDDLAYLEQIAAPYTVLRPDLETKPVEEKVQAYEYLTENLNYSPEEVVTYINQVYGQQEPENIQFLQQAAAANNLAPAPQPVAIPEPVTIPESVVEVVRDVLPETPPPAKERSALAKYMYEGGVDDTEATARGLKYLADANVTPAEGVKDVERLPGH